MIDIQQRTLCSLEEDRRALLLRAGDHESDILGDRQQSRRDPLQLGEREGRVGALGRAEAEQDVIGVIGPLLDQRLEARRVTQVEDSDPAARDLVLIRRSDPAARRADRLARGALLVDELVIGHHEMRAIAEVQPARDIDAVLDEGVDLIEEALRVEHHAIPDRAAHALLQDPARHLVQHRRLVPDVHRVSRIRSTLIAHHPIGALGEHVDELPLPLVPPLGADDNDGAGLGVEHLSCLGF